jgi:hypothetical protein
LLGFSKRSVDFDSFASIVDGTIETDGTSLLVFARGKTTASASDGFRRRAMAPYDLTRRITYHR